MGERSLEVRILGLKSSTDPNPDRVKMGAWGAREGSKSM